MIDMGVLVDGTGAKTVDAGPGYSPGSHWEAAIVECDETFLNLEINGVHGAVQRRVIDPGDFGTSAMCPECLQARDFDEAWRARAANWVAAGGNRALTCQGCSTSTNVEAWAYDPPLGFGNVWVTFWNWPSINREFINRVQHVVGDHVSLIEGKGDSISTLVAPGPARTTLPREPRR